MTRTTSDDRNKTSSLLIPDPLCTSLRHIAVASGTEEAAGNLFVASEDSVIAERLLHPLHCKQEELANSQSPAHNYTVQKINIDHYTNSWLVL